MKNRKNSTNTNLAAFINDQVVDFKNFSYHKNTITAYEVVKIIDGIPLFFKEHYERLHKSVQDTNIADISNIEKFNEAIDKLVKISNIKNGNIEITISTFESVIRFIPHSYPTSKNYEQGIATNFFYAQRLNPNRKIKNLTLKKRVTKFIEQKKVYEALLVNSNGIITEGSRSNFFIIKNNKIITPPKNQILNGVTRNKIIELCIKNNIEIIETTVLKQHLNSIEAAFLTGTSPGILPIARIGNLKLNPNHPLINKTSQLFNQLVNQCIKQL